MSEPLHFENIVITYMSATVEAAEEFKQLLLSHLSLDEYIVTRFQSNEFTHMLNEGQESSYFNNALYLSTDEVENIMSEIDDFKMEPPEEATELATAFCHDSLRTFVLFGNEYDVMGTVSYHHKKSQDMSYEIEYIQKDYDEIKARLEKQEVLIDKLMDRYDSMQAYLYNFIGLDELKKVVAKLGMIIDEDLLNDYGSLVKH